MPPELTLPTYSDLRERLKEVAELKGEWAGLALPLPDLTLITEPRYPYHFRLDKELDDKDQGQFELVNSWYSRRLRGDVLVVHDHTKGTRKHILQPWNMADFIVNNIGASTAWSIEMEMKAWEKLSTLVKEHTLEHYMLTGTFLESSKRSLIYYVFRKLRPTIALRATEEGGMRVLTTLCLHPIGYYGRSWAGVLCPTDDVIAHLLMMRGDERKYWAHAGQHSTWKPESGL